MLCEAISTARTDQTSLIRVGPLVRRPRSGVVGRRSPVEGQRRERLQTVAEHVEPAAGHHHPGQRARVVGVDKAHDRTQGAVGDARLHPHLEEVENRHTGRLAARARCRGYGYERLQRPGNRAGLSDRRVYVGEKVRRVGFVEIGGLGRVHTRAPAHRHVRVEPSLGREGYGLLEGHVRRLHMDPVEQDGVDSLRPQRLEGDRNRLGLREARVRDDHHAPGPQPAHLEPDLAGDARAVLDAGGVEGEGGFQPVRTHMGPRAVHCHRFVGAGLRCVAAD